MSTERPATTKGRAAAAGRGRFSASKYFVKICVTIRRSLVYSAKLIQWRGLARRPEFREETNVEPLNGRFAHASDVREKRQGPGPAFSLAADIGR